MTTTAPTPVALSTLRSGAIARFHEARLDADSCRLLRALGLVASSELRLCKSGEPCIIQVRATRLGLSKRVAAGIFVIPRAEDAA